MGIIDKIVAEGERFGSKFEAELGRSQALQVFTLGLSGGQLFSEARERIYAPIKAAKRAQKEAMAQQREMMALRRRQIESQRAEQAQTQRLMMAEQAKQRRISMAEAITGEQFGMFDSTPADGPNMNVNKIPTLDGIDDMGNSIPEV